MGREFIFQWFGKSVEELKAIRNEKANELTAEELAKLDELIAEKENEK